VQFIGVLLPVLLAFGLVFGPLASWLALRRHRQPIVWLVFGALLGPLAVALLVLAPAGACPQCGETVSGWPTVCLACGENLVPPPAMAIMQLVGEPQPAAWTRPVPDPIPLRRPNAAAPPLAVGPGRPVAAQRGWPTEVVDSKAVQPEPSWAARLATLARAPGAAVGSDGRRSAANGHGSSGGNGSAFDGLGSSRFTVPVLLPPRGPLDPETEDPALVALGVYVSGTERLTIAGRYAIGHTGGRLTILGPYETNPRKVAIEWDLVGIEVGQGEGQVVLARVDGRRARVVTFRLLSTFDRAELDEAIARATRVAEARR
jgi:hypothetical protein